MEQAMEDRVALWNTVGHLGTVRLVHWSLTCEDSYTELRPLLVNRFLVIHVYPVTI